MMSQLSTNCTALLTTWRDIALLGLLHRRAMGKGPAQFKEFCKRDPQSKASHDPCNGSNASITRRSALGLVVFLNLLLQSVSGSKIVSAFQRSLQEWVVKFALAGYPTMGGGVFSSNPACFAPYHDSFASHGVPGIMRFALIYLSPGGSN